MNAPLSHTAARGATLTILGQLARLSVQTAGVVVLARLLSPSEFGLIAMVTAVIGIGEVLRDFGLSSAAIQARDLTSGQRNNLFWMNLAIGVVVGLAAVACAPLLAYFYGDPRVETITYALAGIFVLNGAMAQYRADLYRSLRFSVVVLVDVGSQIAGTLAAIMAGVAGLGYWSLVVQQGVAALTALTVLIVTARWRLGAPRRGQGSRSLFAFGGNVFGVQLLGYLSRNIDSIIVGRTFGAGPLGLYDRAFQLLMLPMNQLNAPSSRVAIPVLARLQDEPARYAAYLVRAQTILLHLTFLVMATGAGLASPLIAIVMGDNWLGAVDLFRILCIGGAFQAAAYVAYWIFMSRGLATSNLRYALCSRPIVIGCIALGSLWGVSGVAAGYSTGLALIWPLALWWVRKEPGLAAVDLFVRGCRLIAVYGVAAASAFGVSESLQGRGVAVSLTAGVGALLLALSLQVVLLPFLRGELRAALKTVTLARRRSAILPGG